MIVRTVYLQKAIVTVISEGMKTFMMAELRFRLSLTLNPDTE